MEANEAQELKEQSEEAKKDASLRPVSFTMSVLAVLVAITTVLGHRTHTEAVLDQARASDQWNLYQAKKNRQYDTERLTEHHRYRIPSPTMRRGRVAAAPIGLAA